MTFVSQKISAEYTYLWAGVPADGHAFEDDVVPDLVGPQLQTDFLAALIKNLGLGRRN